MIDFTPARFEALSCEVLNFDTVTTTDGSYISSEKPMTAFRIYVFNRENNAWKVAARANFTDVDHINLDWEFGFPPWEKDVIGDLPKLIRNHGSCFLP